MTVERCGALNMVITICFGVLWRTRSETKICKVCCQCWGSCRAFCRYFFYNWFTKTPWFWKHGTAWNKKVVSWGSTMFSWNLFLVILCHLPRKAGWTVWKNSQRTHHIHIMWPIGNFVWRWHPQAQQKTWKPWECICTKTATVGSQGPHQHQCCHKPSTVQTLP